MDTKESYFAFLTNCTSMSEKSRNNYIGAIKSCDAYIKRHKQDFTTCFDVDSVNELDIVIGLLDKDEEFSENEKTKWNNMYHNALQWYRKYLCAKELFSLQPTKKPIVKSSQRDSLQKIFFGSPGTGKSFKVKEETGEIDENYHEVEKENVFRTTFHPDTDYSSFVGCYKPTMKPTGQTRNIDNKQEAIEEISYEFIPQVFTDAYVYAYNNPNETTFLVIEEINRGNCAQIFGDLFQLLDRNDKGVSEYAIKADKDMAKYLKDKLGKDHDGIANDKLRLPANLHILATMNTSDQSLFPMDSAFKRRWDWEYVPISYTEENSSQFRITIGNKQYSWVDFIKEVNTKIADITKSEDKLIGNFFIKSNIDASLFKSKVMFYIWNEVLRDEVGNPKYFFFSGDDKFTFKDLYGANAEELLQGFMKELKLKPLGEESETEEGNNETAD